MKKISFNEGTLGFDKNKVTYEVPLEKTNVHSIEEIQFIKDIPFMFPITNLDLTQNKTTLLMEMEVENGFLPLGVFKSNSTNEEKYECIKQLCEMAIDLKNLEKLVTVLDDKNILINPEKQEIKFLYRGVKGLMPASSYIEEEIDLQIKRIALFILTSAKYDEIRINGLDTALNKSSQERYKVVSKIYQANTLNDMLVILEGLREKEEIQQEIVEKPKKSIFSAIKNDVEKKINTPKKPKKEAKFKAIKKEVKPKKERSIKSSHVTFVEDDNTKKTIVDGSKLKVIAGVIISVVLIFLVINIFSNEKSEPTNTTLASSQKDEDLLIEGLQHAAIQDYENATKSFEKVKTSFDDLSEDNQMAILFSYLMTGKYQEAIDAEPKFSYSVINYLVSKDNLDAVNDIDSDEPVILFEKAAINKDSNTVLKFKDEIKLDGRRESLIVDAFVDLNKLDEALDFAKSKGNNDLIDKIENIKKQKLNKQKKKNKQKKQSDEPKENESEKV
ncbi:hypothetical protein BAOM_p048 (plasmid) [Peribacillus asahii]|uniref:Type VII secretion protein EssB n=1 Tax=Peribacillus asahii TaxID=228899 RepID=A0A3T0KZE8_9BACI|nr:hypothetical protein [Peribacillus asahii]AZV45701.1 hypothetical protein BAOM_p048 [Peribacillus asahii]